MLSMSPSLQPPQVRELHRGSGFTADGTEDLQERGTPRGLGAKHS